MSLWLLIVLLLGVIKLPIAALLLWLPFRNDQSLRAGDATASSDDDGGSAVLPAGPLDPQPRPSRPRAPRRRPPGDGGSAPQPKRRQRGDHGLPTSPARVRGPARRPRLPLAH
jgi:hypothetical protein